MRTWLALLLALSPFSAKTQNLNIEEVKQAASKSTGAFVGHSSWHCEGTCRVHGADEKLDLDFSGQRFYNGALGALPDIAGFDGTRCWTENWSGIPHVAGLVDKDTNELVTWLMTGEWSLPDSLLDESVKTESGDGIVLKVKVKNGSIEGTLTLDEATMLPKKLAYWTESGNESWDFEDYKSFEGRTLATTVKHHMTEQEEIYRIDSARQIRIPDSRFEMPRPDLSGTSYNSSGDKSVEFKAIGGYMFVRPLVDGKDIGWFFLDSGADVMCLDTKVARAGGYPVVGSDTTAGVVAVVHLQVCRANTFELGPVAFKNPTFYELDLTDFTSAFRLNVAGICGYDFIARNILDIDPEAKRLSIFPPGKAPLPEDAHWSPITFNGETPCLTCEFEGDHSGLFSIDTGSSSTVDFFSPIVKHLGWLEKATGTSETGGAGGSSESREGKISYFEIGGKRFNNPNVGLQITSKGVFASPYLDGNVGMGFLGGFHLIFDYPDSRIGFVAKG